ncbi:MAG: cell division topological specificity factor MinE [Bacillota bacterium]
MDVFGLFSKKRPASKDIAKKRLQLVLIHDKTDISPQIALRIKNDVITCISRYIDIDEKALEIELTRLGEPGQARAALVANIPILGVKKK